MMNKRVEKKIKGFVRQGRLIQKGERYYDVAQRRWATLDICRSVYKVGWSKVWRLMGGWLGCHAYTARGDHLSSSAFAHRLYNELQIWPEVGLMPGRATIGYSRLDGAWYGWSSTRDLKRCPSRGAALAYGVDDDA